MAITFDKKDKLVKVSIDTTEVTVQQLVDAIRDWLDNPDPTDLGGMDVTSFIEASGKQDLGGGVNVGITLKLINDWRIEFAERTGPTWVSCKVSGGNLVATNSYGDNPIKPSAYTQVTIAQSSSAVSVGGSSADIADAVWNEAVADHVTSGTFGEKVGKKLLTLAKFLGLR